MHGSRASTQRTAKTQSFVPVPSSTWQRLGHGTNLWSCNGRADRTLGFGGLAAASLGWIRHAAGAQVLLDRLIEGYKHRVEQVAHRGLVLPVKRDDRSTKPHTPGGR